MGGDNNSQELKGPDLEKGIAFDDLAENEPLLGHAHGEAVVVVKIGKDVHAIGATCTHYSGPLAEGLVVGQTIRCPWHHACFDLKTGRAIGAPAFGDVACFDVAYEGDLVHVRTKKTLTAAKKSTAHHPSSIVMVGAGAAAAACAEMLRKEGYKGPITLIGAEEPGPVDRPNLSKDYLAGDAPEEWIPLGGEARWNELKVTVYANDPVATVDPEKRCVTTKGLTTYAYGALLFATGAEPSRLPIEGANLPHVHTLRSLADSRAIIEKAKSAKRAVVIGTSFIGLEAAAALIKRGLEVHVVGPDKTPLSRVLGDEVGAWIRKVHEDKGVKFHLETKPTKITDKHVVLDKGEPIECDLVVLGVGVKPRVDLAKAAGLTVDNGVVVNESLRTSVEHVWAAGDVANHLGRRRIEHWQLAERHGEHIAREMLRDPKESPHPFKDVPFFWSAHYDTSVRYVGHIEKFAKTVVYGSIEKGNAAIAYKDANGKSLAVATIDRDHVSLEVEAAMERGDYDLVDRVLSK